jgi:hypothetical protein
MTCFGRPALAVAVVLMLAPLSSEVRTAGVASAGVELARGGKPAPRRPVHGQSRAGPATPGAGFLSPQAVTAVKA